ncbi:unnamed protein product [Parajaminaea phylloscopi]
MRCMAPRTWALGLVVLLAATVQLAHAVQSDATNLVTSWTPPLSTRGRYIVDATGKRFRLRSGNFHGASGTYNGRGKYDDPANHHAGELAYQTVLCLDRKPLDELVDGFLELGINSIRLPFSNAMIHSQDIVPDHALTANPDLRNLTPLEIFDRVVQALTKKGLAVILNNHTVKSLWCCGVDVNARWNVAQSTEAWIQDWVLLAQRYRNNTRVVGADLYNEVRRDLLVDPTWGGGETQDWYTASMEAAVRIQREGNPDLLIMIEGINWVGIPLPLVSHYRPELAPVGELSHALPLPDKLVYCAHFYAYTGPNATGSDVKLGDRSYAELTPTELQSVVQRLAGFVATEAGEAQKHWTAPVWISEFGVGGRNEYSQTVRQWWGNFTDILIQHDLEYAVWPLVGWQERGQGDLWALNAYDSKGSRLSILDAGDWRLPKWRELANSVKNSTREGGGVASTDTWRMLAPDGSSQQQSNWLNSHSLAQPGQLKASCPDGLRLIGMSYSDKPHGLCTDAVLGRNVWNYTNSEEHVVIVNTASQSKWASGFSTLDCPSQSHLIGYSFDAGDRLATVVCAPINSGIELTSAGRTVWLNKGSSPQADVHGRFDGQGVSLGTCQDNEVAMGLAFTTEGKQGCRPAALLCASTNRSAAADSSHIGHSNGALKQRPLLL